MTWNDIEKQKGVYDFSAYDILVSQLEKHSILPYFILDYGCQWYDKGLSPCSDEGRQAFVNFVLHAMEKYRMY